MSILDTTLTHQRRNHAYLRLPRRSKSLISNFNLWSSNWSCDRIASLVQLSWVMADGSRANELATWLVSSGSTQVLVWLSLGVNLNRSVLKKHPCRLWSWVICVTTWVAFGEMHMAAGICPRHLLARPGQPAFGVLPDLHAGNFLCCGGSLFHAGWVFLLMALGVHVFIIYVTPIHQVRDVSRIGYVSDTDTYRTRVRYVSAKYL